MVAPRWLRSVATILVALVVGCGSSGPRLDATCFDICQQRSHCPAAGQPPCQDWCGMTEGMNRAAGCTTVFNMLLDCYCEHDEEICGSKDGACDTALSNWKTCTAGYCSTAPTPKGCATGW
jgi:hypothetical protein